MTLNVPPGNITVGSTPFFSSGPIPNIFGLGRTTNNVGNGLGAGYQDTTGYAVGNLYIDDGTGFGNGWTLELSAQPLTNQTHASAILPTAFAYGPPQAMGTLLDVEGEDPSAVTVNDPLAYDEVLAIPAGGVDGVVVASGTGRARGLYQIAEFLLWTIPAYAYAGVYQTTLTYEAFENLPS